MRGDEVTYSIPDALRAQWRQLAQQADLPYATIVNQQLYDLQNEAETLTESLHDRHKQFDAAVSVATRARVQRTIQQLAAQLEQCQAQIVAYEAELASARNMTGK